MQRCNLSRPTRKFTHSVHFRKSSCVIFWQMTVLVCDTFKLLYGMKPYSCLHQLIFHSFKFNIFNPLCWHSMSDTLTSYSSPFLFHSSLKYFEGGFGKEIPNAILNGTSWDCKIPLTNIFLLLAFLYFMILSLLSSQLLSYILVDLFLLSKWLKWLATLQYQGGAEY